MRSSVRRFSLVLLLSALLVGADALPALAAPPFQMPFFCGEYRRASTSDTHKPGRLAIDFNVGYGNQDLGSIVVASAGGRVRNRRATWGSYGRYVVIDHGDGWETIYAHLASFAVRNGARVRPGDKIGWVGNNKGRFLAHLHYEQRYKGRLQKIRFNGRRIAYRDNPSSVTYRSENNCRAKPPAPPAAKVSAPTSKAATSVVRKPASSTRGRTSRPARTSVASPGSLNPAAAVQGGPMFPLLPFVGAAIVGAWWISRRVSRSGPA